LKLKQFFLPSDWEVVRLEEIISTFGGTTPSTSNSKYWDEGTVFWATPTDITKLSGRFITNTDRKITPIAVSETSLKMLDIGDVVMTSRATIGYPAISKVPLCTNQGFINIKCSDRIDKYFLFYWIIINRNKLIRMSQGSTFLELNKKDFRRFKINLPLLIEQQKIAEILSTVDDAIENTTNIIDKTRELKKGLMQKLFTEGIGHTRFKDTKIGRMPEEWEVMKIGNLINNVVGGASLKPSDFQDFGIKVLPTKIFFIYLRYQLLFDNWIK